MKELNVVATPVDLTQLSFHLDLDLRADVIGKEARQGRGKEARKHESKGNGKVWITEKCWQTFLTHFPERRRYGTHTGECSVEGEGRGQGEVGHAELSLQREGCNLMK